MLSFDEIAENQGWDDQSRLRVLMAYIAEKGLEAELANYANDTAAIENGDV